MKRLLLRCFVISLPVFAALIFNWHIDTFNVFHWDNARFTSSSSNRNFVKTKYIVKNPKKFNAFLFGSSRVGFMPPMLLPKELNGQPLNWYNMTSSLSVPAEQLLMMKTFLKNGVEIKMALLEFDSLAMTGSVENHKKDLMLMPYQVYEENLFKFYYPYLKNFADFSIVKEVLSYEPEKHAEESASFYAYGGTLAEDLTLNENPNMENFNNADKVFYSQKNAARDMEEISEFCRDNGIELVLFTTPSYKTCYLEEAAGGYHDFLRSVAQKCEFYNFCGLNNFTTDPRYYNESVHFRAALGLEVEKAIFGSEEDKAQVRSKAGDDLFGVKVNSQNIEDVIAALQAQLY